MSKSTKTSPVVDQTDPLNALSSAVQAMFERETGRKLGFAKAKELAAKLSGLRNSNVKPHVVSEAIPERFIILPSCDGPDYDIHLAIAGAHSQSVVDEVISRLRTLFSLWNKVDDMEEGGEQYEALLSFMKGEIHIREYLKKYGQEDFGVRYVETDERFAWDNSSHLARVDQANFLLILGSLKKGAPRP